ncbi:hypothetical protein cypCar_00028767, partial [Cyprinus carpio]
HAIEVNKRDYRAWYGLGQTYGILKMPFYSLYYYSEQLEHAEVSTALRYLGQYYFKNRLYDEASRL